MVKLNRTTEYGLIALRHMMRKQAKGDRAVTSAREIADGYDLPFEITAKTLQRLKDTAIIQSEQGARGGYTLAKDLATVTLGEFLELMEGPQAVVGCANVAMAKDAAEANACCAYQSKCDMKDVMVDLNARVRAFLHGIRLDELTARKAFAPSAAKTLTTKPQEASGARA